jgi:polyphosphate kinase
MPRNFDSRVEVACPIKDRALAKQLIDYFQMQWEDTANARIWDAELRNERRTPSSGAAAVDSHERIRMYISRMAGEHPGPRSINGRSSARLGKGVPSHRVASIQVKATA